MTRAIVTLCPHYPRYLRELQSPDGDPASAAQMFLHKVVPFVIECVVTSGIYFVNDFPHSPFTPMLRVSSLFFFLFFISLCSNNYFRVLLGLTNLLHITEIMLPKLLHLKPTVKLMPSILPCPKLFLDYKKKST
jgi:hypothetical protein